jgi:hypothetical protein
MNKEQIAELLQTLHGHFIDRLREMNDADFCFAPEDKWSAGQQLDHLIKSISPVNMAMGLPKFILKWKFGLANRPSKTYEQLVERYNLKLQEGGRASARFLPVNIEAANKDALLTKLNTLVNKLSQKTEHHSEEALDKYILPHPLLGKLTLREMLYFTAYHVEHHRQLVEKGLSAR